MKQPLSSYWAAGHHRALGSVTEDAVRLAIAIGAVKSVVRVVDRTVPPLSVEWAAVDNAAPVKSMSYTDLKGGHIRINPLPILDTKISHGDALDVVIGFGLHEASHSQESRDRYQHLIRREGIRRPIEGPETSPEAGRRYREWQDLVQREGTVFTRDGEPTREVPAFEPAAVAAYLWNLVEDVRIELATGSNWPGFTPYFDRVRDWMWAEMRSRHDLPTEYGSEIADRLRVVFLACRYPDRFAPTDPVLVAEVAWWQAWQRNYLSETVDTPTTIQQGLDHLAEDAETAKEMEAQARAERAERALGEKLRAQLDRLIREGFEGAFEVCSLDSSDLVPLDQGTADAVRELVAEGLIEQRVIIPAKGGGNVAVRARKPTETTESRRSFIGRPDGEAERLRAALVFRSADPQYDTKLLKSGTIDDEELYRWATGDMRVFGERVTEARPDAFMGLLVDISGSMQGRKLKIAQRLAQLFVWAVRDQEGMTTQVWAHTDSYDASEVFRVWESGDPLSRLGLISSLPHRANADGHAIAYVAGQIAAKDQPEKVLVVLSDGLPSSQRYGGPEAMDHVRAVCHWAMGRGVRVVQVAIDPDDIRPEEQARMFGAENFVGFRDYAALPRQITTLMGKYL